MLTEEMLAALIDSMTGVERLVLCGDHRQLPPIGAGRPFADLVAHLRDMSDAATGETGGGFAELVIGRRQKPLVQRFAPEFAEAARPRQHVIGDRWQVDETYLKVGGTWRYLFRAIDQSGQVIDVAWPVR